MSFLVALSDIFKAIYPSESRLIRTFRDGLSLARVDNVWFSVRDWRFFGIYTCLVDHLIVGCSAYDPARDIAISNYKGILGESKFREVINSDDNGSGF